MHTEFHLLSCVLTCPGCGHSGLIVGEEEFRCKACGVEYHSREGIPVLCDENTVEIGFEKAIADFKAEVVTEHDIGLANAIYHNLAAETYDTENRAVGAITETGNRRIEECLRWIREKGASGPLLDFGTGTGHLLEVAEGIFSPRIGLDISSGMLSRAIGKDLPVILANCLRPPIATESTGVVVSHSFLHHFKEPSCVLREMVRVLRPGGWLLLDWEPNFWGRSRLLSRTVSMLRHPELWFRKLAYEESDQMKRLNEIAEYHEAMGPGLDAEALADYLRVRGFRNINIVYHSNCSSAFSPAFKLRHRIRALLDGRWPSDRNCGTFFLILAQAAGGQSLH